MSKTRRRHVTLALVLAYVPLSVAYLAFSGQLGAADWRSASREPAGLAPDPATTPEAVVQVYSARAVSWRGWFGVHTWIAVKPANATEFTVHDLELQCSEVDVGHARSINRRRSAWQLNCCCWPSSALLSARP